MNSKQLESLRRDVLVMLTSACLAIYCAKEGDLHSPLWFAIAVMLLAATKLWWQLLDPDRDKALTR